MKGDSSPIGRAIELHRAGRLAEAEATYVRLLQAAPGDADALHFLGLLRLHQGRRPAAIELVQRSLKLAPNNPHAWNSLGNLLMAEGDDSGAERAYTRATNLKPGFTEAWYNLGILWRRKRQPEEALKSFRRVLDSNPRFVKAYENLALLLYRMGRTDHTADVYRKWLEVEPNNPIPRHMVAATSGQRVPERADDRYVTKVFDDFAEYFDSSLARLDYAAPQILAAALAEHVDFAEGRLEVLDAGCGTGLCGPLLRSTAKTLVGVDLSPGMLAKARERELYDELVQAELVGFMESRPAGFDVVISADTLVYFGALEAAMAGAARCLRPAGVFAFTLESLPDDAAEGFRILEHGRYSHRADYVRGAIAAAGLAVVQIEPVVLRKERGDNVNGYAVLARAEPR